MTEPIILAAACTHIGRIRSRNEDAVLVDASMGLVAVADGLGGRNAGDVASRLAIDTLSRALSKAALQSEWALKEAVAQANAHVYALSSRIPSYAGMGTTLVAGWVISSSKLGPQLVVAHVGDSRLYRYRAQPSPSLECLTRDHSSAQQLIDHGFCTPAEARQLPQRHILTNALGIEPHIDIDLLTTALLQDDLLLLCPDGLSDMLDDTDIAALLDRTSVSTDSDLDALAQRLVHAANDRGGHDNISVVLATPTKISF